MLPEKSMQSEEPKRLHLGCGPRYLPGYIHVDIQKYPHVDVIYDITQDMSHLFAPGSINEIYACHVLEHIPRSEIITTLCLWQNLLKVGGKLRLAVPDFEAAIKVYCENPFNLYESLLGLLYGGQRNPWDFHTFAFDFVNMARLLGQVGFENVERYDWQDFLPASYDDYSRCYIPHNDVDTGRLMSLNVIATKIGPPLLADEKFIKIITKLEIKELVVNTDYLSSLEMKKDIQKD